MFYILSGTRPVKCLDVIAWSEWMTSANRIVDRTSLADPDYGEVVVSTVFLGIDHNYGFGKPQLFETMVFGGELDQLMLDRYSTWEEAEAGHEKAVRTVAALIEGRIRHGS